MDDSQGLLEIHWSVETVESPDGAGWVVHQTGIPFQNGWPANGEKVWHMQKPCASKEECELAYDQAKAVIDKTHGYCRVSGHQDKQ